MSAPITMEPETMAALLSNIPPEVIRSYQPLSPDDDPDIDHLITEDGAPVDNMYSAKQMQLFGEVLGPWFGDRPYLAAADVGLFNTTEHRLPAIVPDFFLSLDVRAKGEPLPKRNRSYFFWVYGKPPECALEIVSNLEGKEDTEKKRKYAALGILYYVIWDPANALKQGSLRLFVLRDKNYVPLEGNFMPVIGLGLVPWQGIYEGWRSVWLRWCDQAGNVLPTSLEQSLRADQEKQRADQAQQSADQAQQQAEQERQRAVQERQRADQERQRADKLQVRLRSLGVDPEMQDPL